MAKTKSEGSARAAANPVEESGEADTEDEERPIPWDELNVLEKLMYGTAYAGGFGSPKLGDVLSRPMKTHMESRKRSSVYEGNDVLFEKPPHALS